MEMLSSKQKMALIIVGVFVVGIFMYYMSTKTSTYDYEALNEVMEETEEEGETNEEINKNEEIVVHIMGAVENEGIVTLKEGDRIVNAIEEAGGLTEKANLTEVNLAYVLKDGQKVYIPSIDDTEEEIIITSENGEDIIVDNRIEESTSSKININTATLSELESLSGIGEATASSIIEYRETNGNFNSIEEIKNVSGIGDAKYEDIKDYICV